MPSPVLRTTSPTNSVASRVSAELESRRKPPSTASTETYLRVPRGDEYASAPGTQHQLELAQYLMEHNNDRGQPYMSARKPDRGSIGEKPFIRRVQDSLTNAGKNYTIRLGLKRNGIIP